MAETVEQHALDYRWREVFLLVAGLLGGQVQKLFWNLKQATFTYIAESQKVKDLVQWSDRIIDTEQKNLSARAAGLGIASAIARDGNIDSALQDASFRCLNLNSTGAFNSFIDRIAEFSVARDIARGLDLINSIRTHKLAFDRDSAINKSLVVTLIAIRTFLEIQAFRTENLSELPQQLVHLQKSLQENSKSHNYRQFADELETILLNGFGLTKEAFILSAKDAKSLANYLYVTELLIRCKESAVRVSKKDWEKLESRLLTLKGYQPSN